MMMPKVIDNLDRIPTEVKEVVGLLSASETAVPRRQSLHISAPGFSVPLPKLLKSLGNWFHEMRCGLWHAMIQSECPVLVRWLLFSMNTLTWTCYAMRS